MSNIVHGECNAPERKAWLDMHRRCSDPGHAAYPNYGGRGINVCARWSGGLEGYTNFVHDIGRRPHEHLSLERIDNDGDYTPRNCKWSTAKEQTLNRRTTKLTAPLVQEIHGRVEHGESKRSVAVRVGISESMVRAIRTERTWVGSL